MPVDDDKDAAAAAIAESSASSSPSAAAVLLNTFTVRRRPYSVLLHDGQLVWQRERSTSGASGSSAQKTNPTVIPLHDLICVRHSSCDDEPTAIDPPQSHRPFAFVLHYAQRTQSTSSNAAATRPSNKWRVQRRRFQHAEMRVVHAWTDALQRHLHACTVRPRHLLVFVNPFGGRQNALRIYEKWAKPLFELAGVEADVVVSQRANQIGDMLQRHLLSGLDGVVCVGGDGTVSEVFNGLVRRAMADRGGEAATEEPFARPSLPVGIIPGGSTDTIAYCLHGTTDVRTAVVHIVLGQRTGLDLASVRKANGGQLLRLYASVMSYGYLGDVAADSERFRWMGPRRYDYSGFKKFVANRGYEGEIHIPDDDDEQQQGDTVDHGAPDDGILCCEQCPRCTAKARSAPAAIANHHHPSSVIPSNNGDEPATMAPPPPPTTMAAAATTRWRVLRGTFFMVNGANLSCACERSPNGFSRFGHIGDGRLDLVLVRHTAMLNNLRLLHKLASGGRQHISDLPFVEIHRVRRFRFRRAAIGDDSPDHATLCELNASTERVLGAAAIAGARRADDDDGAAGHRATGSQWNCDGEVITDADVDVESHCQLVTVFRRGAAMPRPPPSEGATTRCPCGF